MRALDRKVIRDCFALRGQVLTIALLFAIGLALLVGSIGAYSSLVAAQDKFYRDSHFADIWVDLERAPRSLIEQLSRIDGVGAVEARIVKEVRLDWPQSDVAVSGLLLSIPETGQSMLDRLDLVSGGWPNGDRADELLVGTAFAQSWGLAPGDPIGVILNGRAQRFRIAGVVRSPEFVYAARPGNPLPDDRTYAVLWARERSIAAAFDMQGAFNSLEVSLAPGSSPPKVIAELDRRLAQYGAQPAYERRDQPSNRFLSDELAEQRTMSVAAPLVFFAVAIFLLNVVTSRLVESQREEIAALKALGYSSQPITGHYVKFVAVVCALGSAIGLPVGAGYARLLLASYQPFFRFPELNLVLPAWIPLLAVALGVLASGAGAVTAARRVMRLRPAEAMRHASPAQMSRAIGAALSTRARLVVRALLGRPLRTALTVAGLASAFPLIVLGLFWWDAIGSMIDLQFTRVERADAVIAFTGPRPTRAIREIAALPGVLMAEGQRIVPVRLVVGPRSYRLGIVGLRPESQLLAPRSEDGRPVRFAPEGLTLSHALSRQLGVGLGDEVTIEALEGGRSRTQATVTALSDDALGYRAYIGIDALHRLMKEDDVVSQVSLRADSRVAPDLWRRLTRRPKVQAILEKGAWLRAFNEKIAGLINLVAVVLAAFGVAISSGVIYNSARIILRERSLEFGSLRVLGFTLNEVSNLLAAELAVELLAAIPLGLILSRLAVVSLLSMRDNESFQIPATIEKATFAASVLIVIAVGLASALQLRRAIHRIDLIAVLKARET